MPTQLELRRFEILENVFFAARTYLEKEATRFKLAQLIDNPQEIIFSGIDYIPAFDGQNANAVALATMKYLATYPKNTWPTLSNADLLNGKKMGQIFEENAITPDHIQQAINGIQPDLDHPFQLRLGVSGQGSQDYKSYEKHLFMEEESNRHIQQLSQSLAMPPIQNARPIAPIQSTVADYIPFAGTALVASVLLFSLFRRCRSGQKKPTDKASNDHNITPTLPSFVP